MVWNMARANGRAERGHSATLMKEIISMIRNMGSVFFNGQVAIHTKENIKMMKEMALVKWNGLMAAFTKEIGSEEYNMVWGKWYSQMELSRKATLNTMFLNVQSKRLQTCRRMILCVRQEQVLIFMPHHQQITEASWRFKMGVQLKIFQEYKHKWLILLNK